MAYKRLRITLGVNDIDQQTLAKLLGRSTYYIHTRVTGKGSWTLQEAYKICDLLKISIAEMTEYFPVSEVMAHTTVDNKATGKRAGRQSA